MDDGQNISWFTSSFKNNIWLNEALSSYTISLQTCGFADIGYSERYSKGMTLGRPYDRQLFNLETKLIES